MEHLHYTKASVKDIKLLTETRIQVLLAANELPENTDMEEVKKESYLYYKRSLENGDHTAYLISDGSRFAGAGCISFYRVMPTYHNPSGRKAYIMNMYIHPDYRRRGIAYKTLDLLVREALSHGIRSISLEATAMGRPLYEKYGFIPMPHEMELPEPLIKTMIREL